MKHVLYKRSIFLFRRDLRLYDNTGLSRALEMSQEVVPCFIVDPRQVGKDNDYRSMNAIQFMVEALQDLDKQLKAQQGRLYILYGNADACLKKLLSQVEVDALFYNRDYTPFSCERDATLEKVCAASEVAVASFHDLTLYEPGSIVTSSGTAFKIFGAFLKNAKNVPVTKPKPLSHGKWYVKPMVMAQAHDKLYAKLVVHENPLLAVHGTYKDAQSILDSLDEFSDYARTRDFPSLPTTSLSAYLKFGLISVRQAYYALVDAVGLRNPLLTQLYWRDFFMHALFDNPRLLGHAGVESRNALPWSYDKKHFQAWADGKTGFPLVDAGMRQLNATGFMHNRVRMIVASFLTKDLLIDWRWGERYFAQKLVDYDVALNNGNWQWVASTGTCSQPYFRVFNPWIQQKKFDPDCVYIKTWIPELTSVSAKTLHTLFNAKRPVVSDYPLPMLDHAYAARRAIALFKSIS